MNLKSCWLKGFIVLVLCMISLGGITRLTRSGLSIVEWKPVTGILPPLTEADWHQQFHLYQQSPEFKQVNPHFQLSEYKRIFMWEYLHRLLGRLLFLYVLLPGLFLWNMGLVRARLVLLLSALVALQGLFGWVMVRSGLSHMPHVSPYLLALHFFFALLTLLTAQFHIPIKESYFSAGMTKPQTVLFFGLGGLLVLQIFFGCLTSGLKAGFYFNTYPLMGDSFWPANALTLTPEWKNIFENPILVQWTHRWLGTLTLIYVALTCFVFLKSDTASIRKSFLKMSGLILLQFVLGVSTLIFSVPLIVAASHQLVAALVMLAYVKLAVRSVSQTRMRSID